MWEHDDPVPGLAGLRVCEEDLTEQGDLHQTTTREHDRSGHVVSERCVAWDGDVVRDQRLTLRYEDGRLVERVTTDGEGR